MDAAIEMSTTHEIREMLSLKMVKSGIIFFTTAEYLSLKICDLGLSAANQPIEQ